MFLLYATGLLAAINCGVIEYDETDELANKLCQDFYRDFHNVFDTELVSNDEINHGHEGSVSYPFITGMSIQNYHLSQSSAYRGSLKLTPALSG